MSDEGGVTLSEVVLDTTLRQVMPAVGEGALGKWRAPYRNTDWTLSQVPGAKLDRCRAGGITMHPRGVRERALEPRGVWEGPPGKAAAANRTREIRLSGMRGGLTET